MYIFIGTPPLQLRIRPRLSTTVHPQTDGQTERANAVMKQYLHSYVSYQQKDWAAFLGMAKFAANNHMSETMRAFLFLANHGHHLRMNFTTASPRDPGAPMPLNEFVDHMTEAHNHLRAKMRFAQVKQEQYSNSSRSPAHHLTFGSRVWLSTKNIKTARPSKKLDHKRLGPFVIDQVVSSYTYPLVLPTSMKIHPVFHVSLLESASEDPIEGQVMPPPLPVEIEDHKEWEVKEISDFHLCHRRPQYLVKWLGYDAAT